MSTRRRSLLPSSLPCLRSGVVAAVLGLLALPVDSAQAGMIGTGLAPRAVAVGDLNGDGYADLVSGNGGDNAVAVSIGRGNGRFHPKVLYDCGAPVSGVTIADLNGDGHLDVASCSPDIGQIGLRLGAGDGTLGARTDLSVSTPVSAVVGDFDENGIPDLAVAVTAMPSPAILLGTGGGAFGSPTYNAGTGGPHLAVGDVNNDDHLDVAVTNSAVFPYGIAVMLGTGTGTLGSPTLHVLPDAPVGVALADFNLDGSLDLAAVVASSNNAYVALGDGDGTFGPNSAYPTSSMPSGIAAADLDGDSWPDLMVTAGNGSAVSVLLGTGTGAFDPKVDDPAGVNPRAVATGHLDADANLDLAIAAGGSNSICTLHGNGDGTFQVPSGPVYVWAPASGIAFDPAAWLPARNAGTPSDILVFNRGGAVSVGSVPTATVGQLVISGGTEASFSGFFGAATLTVAGGTGDDAVVEEGSKAVLASAGSPVSVNLAFGAHATIYGDVEIRGGASRFQAVDPSGILFQSTGRAIIGPGSSTTPFGNGTGPSGLGSVLFHYGSRYIAQTPVEVFGASAPLAVVNLWPGSRFRMDAAFSPDVSDRTYGDFEYNVPGGNSALSGNGSLLLDSLIVSQGTLSVELAGDVSIRGNIAITACAGPNQLRFVPPVPTMYQLRGSSRQLLYTVGDCINVWRVYASPNVTWDIDNPAGVSFDQAWRTAANINFTQGNIGNLYGWQLVIDSTSTITGASQSTGWVETDLTRRVTADGPLRFDVGDSANYLPMDVDVHGVTTPGYVLAGTYAWDHPSIDGAQLDLSRLVHRSWVLTASNDFGNIQAPTFFGDLDATFSFLASDVDAGADPLQFEMRMHRMPGFPWRATSPGLRTATSTQALGLTPAAVDSFPTLAAGQPITPSLSVSDAAEAEGNGQAFHAPATEGDPMGSVMLEASSASRAGSAGLDAVEITSPIRVVGDRRRLEAVASRPAPAQAAGSLSFRVRLSQAAVVPISVDYTTVDGTATEADGDYVPAGGTLHFAPGDTAQDIVVPFGADTTPERNETFGILLANPTNATIDTPAATGTILDDDDLVAPTAQVTSPNGGEVIHQGMQVDLQWTATDNVAVSGVDIQLVNGGSVTTLASNHPNTGSYLWIASGPPSTKMKFRIVAHDDPGHETTDSSDANWELTSYTIGVDDGLPLAFALSAPAPNPSPAGRNRVSFAVPHEARIRLTVHDVRGRTLATLVDGIVPAGRHVRTWDSSRVAAGVYFLRFEAPGFRADERAVIVR